MDTAELTPTAPQAAVYDGFISYSHAADGLLAPRLQAGLQRFAKPWWKRRAVRIFRDESSLSANPHLWSSITEALDESAWFVLLLSPDAAESPWVNQEVEYWTSNKDPRRILPVLTDGELDWDDGALAGSAAPHALRAAFTEEPRWVDLRFARSEEQLTLENPRFSAAVADIASALHGIPKDELESEEVKQHRRTVRTAWGAAALVGVLAIAAIVFGFQSANNAREAELQATLAEENATEAQIQRDRAEEEAQRAEDEAANAQQARDLARSRELAASAINVLDQDPELSLLLAMEAIDQAPPGSEIPVEAKKALRQALDTSRLTSTVSTGFDGPVFLDMSDASDRLVVTGSQPAGVTMFDTGALARVWSVSTPDGATPHIPSFSPDGQMVAVPLRGPEARVLMMTAANGQVVAELPYPECPTITIPQDAWYPDGSKLLVTTDGPCPRGGSTEAFWIELVDTTTWQPDRSISFEVIPVPQLSDAGVMAVGEIGLSSAQTGRNVGLYDMATLDPTGETTFVSATISKDGSLIAGQEQGTNGIRVLDVGTGETLDVLVGGGAQLPGGVSFSSDNRYLIQSTAGSYVEIWDLTSGEKAFSLNRGEGSATVGLDTDRELLYSAQADGTVKVWDLSSSIVGAESPSELFANAWVNGDGFKIGPHRGVATLIDLNSFDFYPAFFDTETGELLAEGEEIKEGLSGAGWHALPDDRFVIDSFGVTQGEQGPTVFYRPGEGIEAEIVGCRWSYSEEPVDGAIPCLDRDLAIPPADELGTVYGQLVLSMDRSRLAVMGGYSNQDGGWTLWDAVELEQIDPGVVPEYDGVVATFDDDWILVFTDTHLRAIDRASSDVIWQSDPGRFPAQVHENGAESQPSLEIDRDLGMVASADLDGSVHVVDTNDWSSWLIDRDLAEIRGMAFHPSGNQLALFLEGRIEVVDFGTGFSLHTVPIHLPTDGHWLDEERMVVGTGGGVWTILTFSTEELLRIARERRPRSFTSNECALYNIDPCPIEGS